MSSSSSPETTAKAASLAEASPDPVPRPIDHLAVLAGERGQGADPALVLRSRVLSHDALNLRVDDIAAWLTRAVPGKGARVASWAAKGELTCLMPLAAARAGLVHVPINPLLKRMQVAHILSDSGAQLLVGTGSRIATLEPGDAPEGCAVVEEGEALAAASEAGPGPGPSSADPDELAAILYTSGSTGRPKGVMLSHANMWLGAVSVAHYLKLASDDVTLAVLPLSFDYGQNQLFSTWFAGGSVVPLDFLFPRDVAKSCAKHGVTTLAAVPPLWVQLTELEWKPEESASLRRLTNSGGALTVELVQSLSGIFPGADLYPMYGLTEAFRSTYLDPSLVEKHPTSMGKAIPFAEILIIGDDGEEAAAGEEGELVHCGPLVAQGYWQDPQRTAERFKPAPSASRHGGTAVWSGDRVRRDAEGLFHFVGRRDAMIKSAGNRISPQEVEEAALATGLATEAVALGVPDPRLGQAVHLVVRGPGNPEDLAKALKTALPNFMQPQPQHIHWREAMPLNPNGKIDRTALAAELKDTAA
ncbi:MAG: acyl-CoA ligase (AMP-forming), exosortase A system-associated [Erythrobacter sp.]|jgi:acyl-CoA ligase (AMP-forming) (exosortase A-associated)|nr:acyl-CoA ligase (AMP-forming), exosortase A system-associated [Erythrobacter sp.]